MVLKIDSSEYTLSTNLGVAFDIETTKKKKLSKILSEIDELSIEQMAEMLHFGLKKSRPDIDKKLFLDSILNSNKFGYTDLQKELMVFFNLLMSKEKDEDIVRKELNDRMEKRKADLEKEIEEESNEKN